MNGQEAKWEHAGLGLEYDFQDGPLKLWPSLELARWRPIVGWMALADPPPAHFCHLWVADPTAGDLA
jgi:hypothetical protein